MSVFSRLRTRSALFAPGCRKGSFCLHAKLPKILHLSYFNGAKAKKFRDWWRMENEQGRLAVALADIKMTVGVPDSRESSAHRQEGAVRGLAEPG